MKPTVSKATTIRLYTMSLSGKEIIGALNKAWHSAIPENARVSVEIPGGGDYSGMSLDVDECKMNISWETKEEYNADES